MPTILMMVFTSIYSVVDGLFVSNFAGEVQFSAVNFSMPLLMMLSTVGFMFGSGGSALISKTLGEGSHEKANRQFSLFVYFTAGTGVVIGAAAFVLMRPLLTLMGAEGELLENSVVYSRIIIASLPFSVLQVAFQSYCSVAEKSKLGLYITLASGVGNMVLDAVCVGLLGWGLVGAAAATSVSMFIGGALPLLYFGRKNNSLLRLGRTKLEGKTLLRGAANGASEMLSNLTSSLVGMLYNLQLLRFAGESGIAAYGVLMYVNFIFISIFIGFTIGTTPIIGFHYGAQNHAELKNLRRKSMIFVSCTALVMLALAELLAGPIARVFVGYSEELCAMTHRAFRIFSLSFPFAGLGIFASAFFTALNNGLVSGILSAARSLVFQVAAIFTLPLIFGTDGIWMSCAAAEFAAAAAAMIFLACNQKKYQY